MEGQDKPPIDEIQQQRYEKSQREPWRLVFGSFVDKDVIDKETAVFLYNNDFRSLDILQELPVDDLQELKELLSGCPGIDKLGKRIAIRHMVNETKRSDILALIKIKILLIFNI